MLSIKELFLKENLNKKVIIGVTSLFISNLAFAFDENVKITNSNETITVEDIINDQVNYNGQATILIDEVEMQQQIQNLNNSSLFSFSDEELENKPEIILESDLNESKKVKLSPLNQEIDLSKIEQELLEERKKEIVKYLYSEKELEEYRKALVNKFRKEEKEKILYEKFPLAPEEIIALRKKQLEILAAEESPLTTPKLQIRTVQLDVDSDVPLEVSVSKGYATSIVFFDHTGTPWPIKDDEIIGNSKAFRGHRSGEHNNIAVFEILKNFSETNVLLNLEGMSIPVVISLKGTLEAYDARVSVRLPKFGPNTTIEPTYKHQISNLDDSELLPFLGSGKLVNGKRLELLGVNGEAYLSEEGYVFVRSQANLMSPPPIKSMISKTGYNAFKILPSRNLLFFQDGEQIDALLKGHFEVKIEHKNNIFE